MSDNDEEEVPKRAKGKSRKSMAKKPVVNFMQTLGKGIPKKSRKKANKRRIAAEESDDSDEEEEGEEEVEMLSISSGDEDAAIDSKAGPNKEEVEKLPEGVEPTKWKQVNENELAQRVRAMRESKAVPAPVVVVQKIERKKTQGLNNLQSLPRGMECIDPLGLGIISSRTMRLITERSATDPSTNEVVDADLRERLTFFSERFDPILFISRIHQFTSAADLEAGTVALKTDLKGWTQQRKQLVKENFDCFVSCKTTIDDIESKLKRMEDDPEGGSSHLDTCIQGINSMANRAFEPLLERQAQAEKIRAVQGTLQRFRTLFNLPSTIRANIRKGEYDLAVREYRKANSIVLPSHAGILKRVIEEVEKVMLDFKGMLYEWMEDPHIDLTNLENAVRLLLELEPESDPVRRYFSIQNYRIQCSLEKCTLDHEARMESLRNKLQERAMLDENWKKIQQDLHESVDVSMLHSQPIDSGAEELDALRGRYIRRLTAVIIQLIPPFWKVALSVSSGKFGKSKSEEKGQGRYFGHSLEVVTGMIHDIISAYESKVQNTLLELEESNVICPYMTDALMDISKACHTFDAKEAAPTIAVEALRALLFESTKLYIIKLCSWMRASIDEKSKYESWVPVTVFERNKSPYAISSLPLEFREVMVSAMDRIEVMIKSLRNEATSEDTVMLLQEVQESVKISFFNCLLGIAGEMEQIGGQIGQINNNSSFENGYYSHDEENLFHPGSITDPHQQLLMVLSNIGFCKDDLFSEMYNKYKDICLKSREDDDDDKDREELTECFTAAEEKVLSEYTFAKAHYVRSGATNYLLDAGLQWGGAPAVKGVRDPAVELMHTLVTVHAEVFAGCEPLLDKTLGVLVEGLIDTLLSLFHEHKDTNLKSLDANGYCQLMLELEYFETILNQYFTSGAGESLKSLQGILLEKATESCSQISDDDDKQGGAISPDDLIALAQQCSTELLQSELERTRINTACFMESFPLEFAPESVKVAYASFRGSMDASGGLFMAPQGVGSAQRWR
ncbi:exocyst complex component SEC5A-like isoform X1 [Bidens hawaiensis]|uniref:exocyst complex component SEC5A-like isoform X1 n=1 Tax=Bidens hawaiensis TaxID=980011 RepID=UPI004049C32F